MTSEDSDDEPLSVIAASKKADVADADFSIPPKKKRKDKRVAVTIKPNPNINDFIVTPVVQRPSDVWLYLKDFNQTGPYSCLLCSEWFINRTRIIVHYILNHKKDFCGICRYFVANREAWMLHQTFHSPWPCSQCTELFETEADHRVHFSKEHNLVHCRFCYFRTTDNDQYDKHLHDRHSVSNIANKYTETLWTLEYSGAPKYLCLLCSKSNNISSDFYNHYMCYHHVTLRCFATMVSGKDPPFSVFGANISDEFLERELKAQAICGYIEYDQILLSIQTSDEGSRTEDCNPNDKLENKDETIDDNKSNSILYNMLIPQVKQEITSDVEEEQKKDETKESNELDKSSDDNGPWKYYEGIEDFDVASTELIILQKCYYDYLFKAFHDLNTDVIPDNSEIDFEKYKADFIKDIECPRCKNQFQTVVDFCSHMFKIHGMKTDPIYSCRVCAASFDSQNELTIHIIEELGDFEDLWLCQFCEMEFDSREATRKHLSEHWDTIDIDNCFSPHLGFKCKYCPTLFWNETNREMHMKKIHFTKHKEEFLKCGPCSELFSDKIFYIHHYMEKHQKDESEKYMIKCSLCCIVFANIDDIREHFAIEHPDARKIFCSLDPCSYKPLAQRKSFKIHLKTIHGPDYGKKDGKVTCTICYREFVSSRSLSNHVAQVHGPGRFKCKICQHVLQTSDERKLHYLIRHPGRHPFECNICGKSFPYKSSLYTHKADHKAKPSFTCSYCNKVFMKRDSYREHVLIHEGPRHACSYCPMRFVQRSNMLRHERRHTGERPYSCQHCPRTFADKGACSSHLRTHLKDKSFPCLYCGQTFVQKSKLNYHIRKHTGENLEKCEVCGKMFTSACSLREHMKTHNKAKGTVPCPLCDKMYQDERNMLRHVRGAHTRSEFTCPICEKVLTSAVGLRHHVITHSTRKTFQCKKCPKSFAIKRSLLKHIRRRHGITLNGYETFCKDYFVTVDIRDCQIGLDEEMLTKIFGPPKGTPNAMNLTDLVAFSDPQSTGDHNTQRDPADAYSEDEKSGSDESESGDESNEREFQFQEVKIEPTSEGELEPTDFVSVKIEPMEYDSEND